MPLGPIWFRVTRFLSYPIEVEREAVARTVCLVAMNAITRDLYSVGSRTMWRVFSLPGSSINAIGLLSCWGSFLAAAIILVVSRLTEHSRHSHVSMRYCVYLNSILAFGCSLTIFSMLLILHLISPCYFAMPWLVDVCAAAMPSRWRSRTTRRPTRPSSRSDAPGWALLTYYSSYMLYYNITKFRKKYLPRKNYSCSHWSGIFPSGEEFSR